MVNRKINCILFCSLSLFVSCFEISDQSLYEDYKPKLVIEASLNTLAPPYFIKISQSAPPDGEEEFFPVNNARILINDSHGNEELARWVSPGTYEVGSFFGLPQSLYNLFVTIDDVDFSATELMPMFPIIDSVSINYRLNYVDGSGFYFKLFLNKEPNVTSYYKVEVERNDSLFNGYSDLLIFEDSYSEDQYIYILPYAFNTSDSVSIKLHSISEPVYKYFYGLTRQTTNVFSNIQPPMLNPESNISFHVLGYFQASAITSIDTVIVVN